MNKFQRKEAREVRRTITYYPIRYHKDAKYKIVRRKFRKMARILEKRNKQAHKEASNTTETSYIRGEI